MKISRVVSMTYVVVLVMSTISFAEGTTAEMIKSWKKRTEQGDVYAPFNLGYVYATGDGVKKNLTEAAKWYRLGADRGDMQAALNLATMYDKGKGVNKNEEKAIELYVKVAKSDTWHAPIALTNLLLLTRNYSIGGEGVKPNREKARVLFERLFEIEEMVMDRGKAQAQESHDKLNKAVDAIEKVVK